MKCTCSLERVQPDTLLRADPSPPLLHDLRQPSIIRHDGHPNEARARGRKGSGARVPSPQPPGVAPFAPRQTCPLHCGPARPSGGKTPMQWHAGEHAQPQHTETALSGRPHEPVTTREQGPHAHSCNGRGQLQSVPRPPTAPAAHNPTPVSGGPQAGRCTPRSSLPCEQSRRALRHTQQEVGLCTQPVGRFAAPPANLIIKSNQMPAHTWYRGSSCSRGGAMGSGPSARANAIAAAAVELSRPVTR